MKVQIIPTRCTNQRKCYRLVGDFFVEDDYGFPWPRSVEVPSEHSESVRRAMYACPSKAILVDEP